MANIASDAKIEGTIKFGETMRIDGKVDGKIIADNGELVVSETGIVKATVEVKSAVIEGRVEGNITASKVQLKQKANLTCNLKAKTLVIEEGVVFVGHCNVGPEGVKPESQSQQQISDCHVGTITVSHNSYSTN